ncbi:hypothetical protein HNQ71_001490 [Mesorhizobium sangaii]|uniref:Uncharacterized protein n=1 Tax=Mesorhizobium sangaii TaxID=505389 RepID=A0A841P0Y6_9HYPH|nr:hypothetical protein [Mesorhizobium sangaii]
MAGIQPLQLRPEGSRQERCIVSNLPVGRNPDLCAVGTCIGTRGFNPS